jgi:hypothetical protein
MSVSGYNFLKFFFRFEMINQRVYLLFQEFEYVTLIARSKAVVNFIKLRFRLINHLFNKWKFFLSVNFLQQIFRKPQILL